MLKVMLKANMYFLKKLFNAKSITKRIKTNCKKQRH